MDPLVLQVIPTLGMGGAERFVIELCARLPAHGFRTRLVVLFDRGPLWQDVRERNLRWVQAVPSHATGRLHLISRLRRMIYSEADRCPVIVHTHLFGSDVWTMAARSVERMMHPGAKQPIFISTAHNIDHEDGSLRRRVRQWAVRKYDRVIGVSEDVRRYAIEDLGVSTSRASAIDGMVFLSSSRPPVPFQDPPRLLTVARLVPQKGIETALRALSNVPPPWKYDIVGDGPLLRDLKELAERLGIASRVRFLGVRNDVPERLADADLFLFPSRWEGLGSAALEAAAAGLPALVSDLPSLQSAFPASQRLPIGDAGAWSKAIRAVLRSPDQVLESARRRAPLIAERFDPNRIVKQYAEAYKTLLRESK